MWGECEGGTESLLRPGEGAGGREKVRGAQRASYGWEKGQGVREKVRRAPERILWPGEGAGGQGEGEGGGGLRAS